ncbi:hypothetical protein L9F63_004348, partial [Diploptera punctata]
MLLFIATKILHDAGLNWRHKVDNRNLKRAIFEQEKINERFRRLIPYMTFYFAQQNFGNRPQYQDLNAAVPIIPVTNNKLSSIPQYQGNLVVPSTYLLQYTPKQTSQQNSQRYPTPSQQITNERLKQLIPRPFTPSNNGNNINIQNSNQYKEPSSQPIYQAQPIKDYVTPRTVTQSEYDSERSKTISQVIDILQAIRKLPQRVTPENREQTLLQLIDILQQTNQLPTNTLNNLAKVLNRIPQYSNIYESLSAPVSQTPQITPVTSRPKYYIYANNPNSAITKSLLQTYNKPNYVSKISQITTPIPEQVQNIDDYENYDDQTPQLPIQKPKQPIISRPLPIFTQSIPVSTAAPVVANDLQNYDYTSDEIPDKENSNKPQILTTVPVKNPETSTPIPENVQNIDDLKTYNYATKVPKPNHFRGPTTTQIFPAPNSEGGTPGRPGIDYPIYSSIPETTFNCKNQRYKGFFGDPDTSCQVWHYCDLNGGQASFLCPNGTVFSQVGLTCDWWFNVRCSSTPQLYVLNERLYKYILPVAPSFPEDFSGPLVDQYLTLKFREIENKKKMKESNTNKTETAKPSKASTTQKAYSGNPLHLSTNPSPLHHPY